MKRTDLVNIIREILEEDGNVTGNVGGYSTPNAFSKKSQGKNSATKFTEKAFGMKTVERPKHPSHSKMVDYLDEMQYNSPNAFTSEKGLFDQPAVKYSKQMEMKVVDEPKKLSTKTIPNYSDK